MNEKLKEAGYTLPEVTPLQGMLFSPIKEFGDKFVYVSGTVCPRDRVIPGKLGKDLTVEQGKEMAKEAMLNILAILKANLGDLNKVKGCVKLLTFVASAEDFYQQPQVANGGSEVLAALYGKENLPARSAIGVISLPGNSPVETEAIFEVY